MSGGLIRNDTGLTKEEALEKVKDSPRITVGKLTLRVEPQTLADARAVWASLVAHEGFDHMAYRADVAVRHGKNAIRLNKLIAKGKIGPKAFMDQVQADALFLFVSSN